MWCYVVGQVYSSILRDCSAFIFKVKEFVVWPWIYRHYDLLKSHRLLALWRSITPLKTCMCSSTTTWTLMTSEATCRRGLLQCLWLNTHKKTVANSIGWYRIHNHTHATIMQDRKVCCNACCIAVFIQCWESGTGTKTYEKRSWKGKLILAMWAMKIATMKSCCLLTGRWWGSSGLNQLHWLGPPHLANMQTYWSLQNSENKNSILQ